MTETFPEIAVRDPRLAVHAAAPSPAWVWSSDGAQLLWANAAGAAALNLRDPRGWPVSLGLTDPHRRQVSRLVRRLPLSGAPRLERMRGFGAPLGHLATCACTRLDLPGHDGGILIVNIGHAGKAPPLRTRLQFVVDGFDRPAAAVSADGALLAANRLARRFATPESLALPDLADARREALEKGRAEVSPPGADFTLQRIGSGRDTALVVLAAPSPAEPDGSAADEAFGDEILVETDGDGGVVSTTSNGDDNAAIRPIAAGTPPVTPEREHAAASPAASNDGSVTAPADAQISNQRPLRFLWQMDAETRVSFDSDEISPLIGPLAAAARGRPWQDLARQFGLDPDGRVARAIAARETWSGVVVNWPIGSKDDLPIELSGLPIYDRDHAFAGYRGFGICRDLTRLARLAGLHKQDAQHEVVSTMPAAPRAGEAAEPPAPASTEPDARDASAQAPATEHDAPPPVSEHAPPAHAPGVESAPPSEVSAAPIMPPHPIAPNVVPFRPTTEIRPALSAVENHAFDEIARRLSARLDRVVEESPEQRAAQADFDDEPAVAADEQDRPIAPAAAWATAPPQPTSSSADETRQLLDRITTGLLIYRLDRLLYANAAFLRHVGFESLHALSEAGGLDALYVEPLDSSASSDSEDGTPLRIAAQQGDKSASFARLFTISWNGDQAMALIFGNAPDETAAAVAVAPAKEIEPQIARSGEAAPDDLAAIIETVADGVVLFDREGNILSCNHSAAALFNEQSERLTQRNLADLFAPESQSAVLAYYEGLDDPSGLDHGREVLGRVRGGGLIPLSMTMGRTGGDGGRYFAVFRDLSQIKRNEAELQHARRRAEQALEANADTLARISHEIREPLNAIIGFAEGMLEQRFGPLGSERYAEYMRDIRTAGEHVLAIVADVLDLSRIEAGKRELTPVRINLNDLVAQCVGTLQPQANRERIIIRSSLARHLPFVFADQQTLRQMVANLITSSIQLANSGGQIIVSTAVTDNGDVALRVRDTGHGFAERDIDVSSIPERKPASGSAVPETASVSFALGKALAEANHAQFQIKRGPHPGTLIEVIFSQTARVLAQA